MKAADINIRDPYVLVHEGKYYLYGTRSETCWGEAQGFDCYVGDDLSEMEGPIEIFKRPEGFFADRAYWAPECYFYDDAFWLLTTLGAGDRKKGVYIMRSESPVGPFKPYGERLTPGDETCIDGTLYFEDGKIYMVYSHSFEDGGADGDFDCVELSGDLSKAAGAPATLIKASSAPFAKPVPFAKEEFGMEGDVYFSDGPSLLKGDDGRLYMAASSWSDKGYAVGVAVSESGSIKGPWMWQDEALYPENGGHGMFFKDKDGSVIFALHYPNDKYKERPAYYRVEISEGKMKLCTKL